MNRRNLFRTLLTITGIAAIMPKRLIAAPQVQSIHWELKTPEDYRIRELAKQRVYDGLQRGVKYHRGHWVSRNGGEYFWVSDLDSAIHVEEWFIREPESCWLIKDGVLETDEEHAARIKNLK